MVAEGLVSDAPPHFQPSVRRDLPRILRAPTAIDAMLHGSAGCPIDGVEAKPGCTGADTYPNKSYYSDFTAAPWI